MLVAGHLSLLAPVAAQASDMVNIEEIGNYTRRKKKSSRIDSNTFINKLVMILHLKGRVDGLEAKQNNYEAGSFSDTTSLSGKAVFAIGAIDHPVEQHDVLMLKHYLLSTNTL